MHDGIVDGASDGVGRHIGRPRERGGGSVGGRNTAAAEEWILPPPLIQQAEGTYIAGRGGSRTEVAVHHYTRTVVVSLSRTGGIVTATHPDVPGPEDIAAGILSRDDSIAIFQSERGCESNIIV